MIYSLASTVNFFDDPFFVEPSQLGANSDGFLSCSKSSVIDLGIRYKDLNEIMVHNSLRFCDRRGRLYPFPIKALKFRIFSIVSIGFLEDSGSIELFDFEGVGNSVSKREAPSQPPRRQIDSRILVDDRLIVEGVKPWGSNINGILHRLSVYKVLHILKFLDRSLAIV